jgi:hypothetical protein
MIERAIIVLECSDCFTFALPPTERVALHYKSQATSDRDRNPELAALELRTKKCERGFSYMHWTLGV